MRLIWYWRKRLDSLEIDWCVWRGSSMALLIVFFFVFGGPFWVQKSSPFKFGVFTCRFLRRSTRAIRAGLTKWRQKIKHTANTWINLFGYGSALHSNAPYRYFHSLNAIINTSSVKCCGQRARARNENERSCSQTFFSHLVSSYFLMKWNFFSFIITILLYSRIPTRCSQLCCVFNATYLIARVSPSLIVANTFLCCCAFGSGFTDQHKAWAWERGCCNLNLFHL